MQGLRVVEIPDGRSGCVDSRRLWSLRARSVYVLQPRAVGLTILLGLIAPLGFLLALVFLYEPVNHFVALRFGHLGQGLERVLQVNSVGMGHQHIEQQRAVGQLLVVFAVLVQQSDGFAIAAMGMRELLCLPIEVAQTEQQHSFFYTRPRGFLVTSFVGMDSAEGVAVGQIDIAHGVIDLIEVFFVVVVSGHSPQAGNHLFGFSCCRNLRHGDTGIELELVGRVLAQHGAIGFVGFLVIAKGLIELSEQEPLSCPLLGAHLMANHLSQIGNSLFVFATANVVVG